MCDGSDIEGPLPDKNIQAEASAGDPWYALSKLRHAVWKLATGEHSIKARLADAYIELAIIQEADLPSGILERWKDIRADLTRGRMQYELRIVGGEWAHQPIGLLYSTLRTMRTARTVCRHRATDMLVRAEGQGQQVIDQAGASTALLADLLRRSGRLTEARRVIGTRREGTSEDIILRILDFQASLVEEGDVSCHTIAEAMGEQ